MADFKEAIKLVKKWEGGETTDTGGHTRFGISKKGHPDVDIANLTWAQASAIYKREYWTAMRGGDIDSQVVANALFLAYVNIPPRIAVKSLQSALWPCGTAAVDGVIGPHTLKCLNNATYKSPALEQMIVRGLTVEIIAHYRNLCVENPRKYKKYLVGWLNRALDGVGL